MKKLLTILFFAAFSFISYTTQAQIKTTVTPLKDTIIGTDSTFANISSVNTLKSITAKVTRNGSTYIRGKVYLQGYVVSTSEYDTLDSLSITNVATSQRKTFSLVSTGLPYYGYRLKYVSDTSIGTWNIYAYMLRR